MTTPRRSLDAIVAALHSDPKVEAVHLGGSCIAGKDDEVSDLDLWVQAEDWSPRFLGGLIVAGRMLTEAGLPFFHGIDIHGTIVDILIGPQPWENYQPLERRGTSAPSRSELANSDLFTEFWMNTYKHRKPLFRNLDAMVCFGLHYDRMFLLRAWALKDSGEDPSGSAFTIHGMSRLISDLVTPSRQCLLGMPSRTREEIVAAIVAYREEVLAIARVATPLSDLVIRDAVFEQIRLSL